MKFFTNLASFIFILLPLCSFAQRTGLINSGELLDKASILYDSGEYKKALLLYDQVTRDDTNYVKTMLAKALSCQADSQYEKSIQYCKEGLASKDDHEYDPDLYNTYGNTLNNMGRSDEALKVFDTAISKFPSYSLLYFNKGVVYLTMSKPEEAEKWFQKTLLINPYMFSAHYQLGIAALRQGKIIPAFLSFIGYLMVSPDGKYESKCIALLDAISKSTDDILEYKNKRTVAPDENSQAIEEIVLSRIALDKGYKPLTALDDPISRQIQVVFEKMDYSETSKDFWVQYYLPFYKQVFNSGKFELFVNHIFSDVNIPIIREYNKKKKKELEAFLDDIAIYLNLIRTSRELAYTKRESTTEKYIFNEGSLAGKGEISANGKQLAGRWHFYFPAGNLKSIGQFDDAGERDGDWTFYYFSGKLKANEHYVHGKLEGKQENYFESGLLSSKEYYVHDQLDGLYLSYYYVGTQKSAVQYKQGKIEGQEKQYYSNGAIMSDVSYNAGVQNGTSLSYYKSGQLKEKQEYQNGKLEGAYKSFYENGVLNVEGSFRKDKADGEWKYYYENGKLKEKRNYINDAEEGAVEEYFENGKLESKYPFRKGKVNGEALYYDEDGKLYSKYVFNNGAISSAQYFDKSGKVLSSSETRNNSIDIRTYTPAGFIREHHRFNKNGDADGADTLFFASGKINQINQYKNGEMNGTSVTYYLNGNKKSEVNMTGGKEDGYYKGYYFNGQLQSEGWFVDGQAQGDWYYYDELGKMTTKNHYLDGELSGYHEEYYGNGKKSLEEKYHAGWLVEMTQFDTVGNILITDSFPKGTGKFVMLHQSGKKMVEADYVQGDFDGAYKTYYFDGSLNSVQYYKKGIKDSVYTSYYWGGIKASEGGYKYGKKNGTWKSFNEDGSLSATAEYSADALNGSRKFYRADGSLDFESLYKDDQRDGVASKYEAKDALSYQVLYKDDNVAGYSYRGTDGRLVPFIPVPEDKGSLTSYFPNGKISRRCSYNDGKINGPDILYYSNGQVLSTDTTSYGEYEGLSKEFYEDGKIRSVYNYRFDNLNGFCREFYKNGAVKKEMNYLNGLAHGLTKYYDEKGNLVRTMLYYYGTLISAKNEK